jgi:ferredoxin-NADP reductase
MGGPLLLVAGGSGIVPLMAMIRHRARSRSTVPTRVLYSVRSPDDVIYFEELMQRRAFDDGLEIVYTFTRAQPLDWTGYARRIDQQMLAEVAGPLGDQALAYVCGPTSLVEAVATGLVEVGIPADRIRTERFGPTGDIAS